MRGPWDHQSENTVSGGTKRIQELFNRFGAIGDEGEAQHISSVWNNIPSMLPTIVRAFEAWTILEHQD